MRDKTLTMAAMIAARIYGLASPQYAYDPNALVYVDADGMHVSSSEANRAVDDYNNDELAVLLLLLTSMFLDGSMTVDKWQEKFARELKNGIIANYLVGRGVALDARDYDNLGRFIGEQFAMFDRMAKDIAAGRLTQPEIMARVKKYAIAAAIAYWLGRDTTAAQSGFVAEQRFLNPAEHCPDCVYYASLGAVPIGTTPPIGRGSICGSNCACNKVYYRMDGSFVGATE